MRYVRYLLCGCLVVDWHETCSKGLTKANEKVCREGCRLISEPRPARITITSIYGRIATRNQVENSRRIEIL